MCFLGVTSAFTQNAYMVDFYDQLAPFFSSHNNIAHGDAGAKFCCFQVQLGLEAVNCIDEQ